MDETHQIVFDTICKARKLILRDLRADSCVISTSVACRAAAHFGIVLEPVHVSVMIFNPYVAKKINERNLNPYTDVETVRELALSEKGWSVGLGHPGPDGVLPKGLGHLIAANPEAIIDLSLDQAARPHKHMNLAATWTAVPTESMIAFLAKQRNMVFNAEGCLLIYERTPGTTFLESNDWTKTERSQPYVDWIIKNAELKLAKRKK